MLVFKSIGFKNFMSSGNNMITVPLDTNKVTVITGANGHGKTLIASALYYALYGKSYSKVKLDCLVNTINKKNMLVEVVFNKNGVTYTVKRGQKPNIFEIYEDGVLHPVPANIKDYQRWFADVILQMDEKTYRQLVIMGSSSYVPFMKLTASERRTVIENTLDIGIFSIMNQVTKGRASGLNTELSNVEKDSERMQWKLDNLQKNVNEMIKTLDDSIEDYNRRINNTLTEIKDGITEIDKLKETMDSYTLNIDDYKKLNKMIRELTTLVSRKEQIRKQHQKEHDFFLKYDTCPTCHQDIDSDLKEYELGNRKKVIEKDDSDMKMLESKMKELQDSASEIERKQSQLDELKKEYKERIFKLNELSKAKELYESEIKKHTAKKSELRVSNQSEIDETMKEYEDLQVTINNIKEQIDSYMCLLELLKDTGVKSIVIKNYLPTINALIKKYLGIIGFNCTCTFDEFFNETIKSRGRDEFQYESFSEGERLRIDFALMFMFRELAKIRSSIWTNLIILDEFADRMDTEGIDSLTNLFKNSDSNILVISHYPEPFMSVMDRHISVEKKNNFSTYKI